MFYFVRWLKVDTLKFEIGETWAIQQTTEQIPQDDY